MGRFDPFVDDYLNVGQRLSIRLAIRRTAGQLWNLGDYSLILAAPL